MKHKNIFPKFFFEDILRGVKITGLTTDSTIVATIVESVVRPVILTPLKMSSKKNLGKIFLCFT